LIDQLLSNILSAYHCFTAYVGYGLRMTMASVLTGAIINFLLYRIFSMFSTWNSYRMLNLAIIIFA